MPDDPETIQAINPVPDPEGTCDLSQQKREGRGNRLKEWTEMVKIEHTVFALPFALSGLLLGSDRLPTPAVWLWTIIAFAAARAAAMTLNRLIDAGIDAANPRTENRAIPAGRISPATAFIFAVVSFALMIFAAMQLPPLCLTLSPVAVLWLSFYSYTKRFTWSCHLVLGAALGGAALGGWIAAGGQLNSLAPWLLALRTRWQDQVNLLV
jgi:4-hydroxybenzoate polyprenyltransferase